MGKIKRKEGDIFLIELEKGFFSFGRVLKEPLMAFYNYSSDHIIHLEEIISKPIAFIIWVTNDSVESGRWPILGNIPLEDKFNESIKFFKQDLISKKLYIYENGIEKISTKEECDSLERAAVWSPNHVEDRLRDLFNGVPNKWVESMKLK